MASRVSGTRKSKGRVTTKEHPGRVPGTKPRPHRNDTTEARQQREGMPKTHPTRATGTRKDK